MCLKLGAESESIERRIRNRIQWNYSGALSTEEIFKCGMFDIHFWRTRVNVLFFLSDSDTSIIWDDNEIHFMKNCNEPLTRKLFSVFGHLFGVRSSVGMCLVQKQRYKNMRS